jgi:hypothetical protein
MVDTIIAIVNEERGVKKEGVNYKSSRRIFYEEAILSTYVALAISTGMLGGYVPVRQGV